MTSISCNLVIDDFIHLSSLQDQSGMCRGCGKFVGEHPRVDSSTIGGLKGPGSMSLAQKRKLIMVWNPETDEFEEEIVTNPERGLDSSSERTSEPSKSKSSDQKSSDIDPVALRNLTHESIKKQHLVNDERIHSECDERKGGRRVLPDDDVDFSTVLPAELGGLYTKSDKKARFDNGKEPDGNKAICDKAMIYGGSKHEKFVDPVDDDIDDDVEMVVGARPSASCHSESLLVHEEVAYTGHTGDNALSDFPHARENCAVHKFRPGEELSKCANCYCYVCDIPASACEQWADHCKATHGSMAWRQERSATALAKNVQNIPTAKKAAPAGSGFTTTATVGGHLQPRPQPRAPTRGHNAAGTAWRTCAELLKLLDQVYPVEAPDPPGLAAGVVLRPYQRQSLAFMLDIEHRIEVGDETAGQGGWLADEMGMGKTAVCASLILANPKDKRDPSTYQATLVVTNATLTHQWATELQKFAPTLRVGLYHGSQKVRTFEDRDSFDVIITTFGVCMRSTFGCSMSFHRKIIDEFHQGMSKDSCRFPAKRVWCVSGTPFSSAVTDLSPSAGVLGHWQSGICLQRILSDALRSPAELVTALRAVMIRHTKSQRIAGEQALALPESTIEVVNLTMNETESSFYRQAMTKSVVKQSLQTFGLEMVLLQRRQVCANVGMKHCRNPVPTEERTKLKFLLDDLNALRRTEPNMHAVVFTHHDEAFVDIKRELEKDGFVVRGVSSTIPIPRRHEQIVDFQTSLERAHRGSGLSAGEGERGGEGRGGGGGLEAGGGRAGAGERDIAKVFIATIKIGNIGITLTAASRVYLFEPCLDPQMEAQAAGRIHRLGQTRPVTVKKLVFRNTVESCILTLHENIAAGRVQITNGCFPPAAILTVMWE